MHLAYGQRKIPDRKPSHPECNALGAHMDFVGLSSDDNFPLTLLNPAGS